MDIAEEIKSRANIVDVVGRSVTLRRVGSRWVGLCPFHNEKTGSFYVNESSQRFHCFGCGADGDVINFYERHYNLNFLESAEKLATEYGIEWKPGGNTLGESKKAEYYLANKAAARFFYDAMREAKNPAHDYMLGRGIDEKTLKKFGIGYADSSEHSLTDYLRNEKVSLVAASEIGLIVKDGDRYRDMFRNRVMFPIINTRDKVIGFGGRDLSGNARAKYMNSKESQIFIKGSNLYAINITKDYIHRESESILVEGYMDVISLFQHGIGNVTASLGTALTPGQARMLKRYSPKALLAYDADDAGVKAALRGLEVLKNEGLTGKVLVLDDMKDPDEYIRKHSADEFRKQAAEALPFMDFKLNKIKEKYDIASEHGGGADEPHGARSAETLFEGSVGFLREAAVMLRALSPVEADYYIKKLAADTGIAEGAIHMEVYGEATRAPASGTFANNGDRYQSVTAAVASENTKQIDPGLYAIQRTLIRIMLHAAKTVEAVKQYAQVFVIPSYWRIFENILSISESTPSEEVSLEELEDLLEDDERKALADILKNVVLAEDTDLQLRECIREIELTKLKARETEILNTLQNPEIEEERKTALQHEQKKIREEIAIVKEN
jgi:DNA primase